MINAIAQIMIFTFPPFTWLYAAVSLLCAPSKWKKYLFLLGLTVFIISYSYHPISNIDLVAYFNQVELYGRLTLKEALTYQPDGSFIRDIIFWIIGKLQLPHLLPAISTTCVYGVAWYISCNSASNYGLSKYIPIIIGIQTMLLPFNSIVSNVCNISAFSLIVLGVYLELYEKKSISKIWPLYVFPCFIHTSAIILVGLRLLLPVMKKKEWLAIGGTFLAPLAINLLYQNVSIFSFAGATFTTLVSQLHSYLTRITEVEKHVLNSSYYRLARYIAVPAVIIMIIIIFYLKRLGFKTKSEYDYANYIFLICIITVCSSIIFIAPHYWRTACAAFIACPPILLQLFHTGTKRKCKSEMFLFGALLLFALARFALDIVRGLRNVYWVDFIFLFFQNNIFYILFQFVKNLLELVI